MEEPKNITVGEEQEQPETHVEMVYISGEYLSAACQMIAWQFLDSPEEPASKEEFRERAERLMRQHCPLAYAFFFENSHTEYVLPPGTLDIILSYIWQHNPKFLGGKPNGGIILPK
jgi:hypothetical protein